MGMHACQIVHVLRVWILRIFVFVSVGIPFVLFFCVGCVYLLVRLMFDFWSYVQVWLSDLAVGT